MPPAAAREHLAKVLALLAAGWIGGAAGLFIIDPAISAPFRHDVDPNGEVLVVANRDSSNLAVFKIGGDGKLTPLGQPQKLPDQPTGVVIRYQP